MTLSRIVEQLEATDVSALAAGGVAARLRDLQRLRGFVASTEHALARRANVLAASGSGAPAGEVLGRVGHTSPREAERTSRRAETLGDLPGVTAQLGRVRIGTEHADSLANAAHRLTDSQRERLIALDDELARTAAATTPSQFRRFVAHITDQLASDHGVGRSLRQRRAAHLAKGIKDATGMYWLRAELDPERGARLFRAIDAEAAALAAASDSARTRDPDEPQDRGHVAAVALVELATSASRASRPGSLIPACSRHHHLAHEGGWKLELDADTRELTITLPDGTIHRRSRPHSVAATTVGAAA